MWSFLKPGVCIRQNGKNFPRLPENILYKDLPIFNFFQVQLLEQVLQHPFQRQEAAERAGYSLRPPAWAKHLKVSCSSWGKFKQARRIKVKAQGFK